jgi:hypothetical protein
MPSLEFIADAEAIVAGSFCLPIVIVAVSGSAKKVFIQDIEYVGR